MSSYLTIVVVVQQILLISVSALTLDNTLVLFNAKHDVHFWEESIEDGGEECRSERLLLKKRESLEKLLCMKSTSGSRNGAKRWLGQEEGVSQTVPCW